MNMLTVNLIFSTLVFWIAARIYVLPRLKELKPQIVLLPILLLHGLRHLGLMFLAEGATLPGMPLAFARPAAFGDLLAAVLAVLAIPAVVTGHAAARMLVLAFNVEGTLDLLVAIVLANVHHVAPYMGPAYWIPAFWVPALLVTHYVTFLVLWNHWNAAAWKREAMTRRLIDGRLDMRVCARQNGESPNGKGKNAMSLQLRAIRPLLQVFDMPASLAFYRDVLGFEVIGAAPPAEQVHGDEFDWVWLRRDGAELMLNTAYDPDAVRPPAPDPARVAAHDDTALFIGCPDVDGAYQHLRAHGVAPDPPRVAPYGMKQLYVKDPDGFTLCFQWAADAPREAVA